MSAVLSTYWAGSYHQSGRLEEVDQRFALLPNSSVRYRDPARPYLSRMDKHLAPHLFDWRLAGLYDYALIYDRGGKWRGLYSSVAFRRIYEHNGWIVPDLKERR